MLSLIKVYNNGHWERGAAIVCCFVGNCIVLFFKGYSSICQSVEGKEGDVLISENVKNLKKLILAEKKH